MPTPIETDGVPFYEPDTSKEQQAILLLADELAQLKGRVDLMEDGAQASNLKFSSIENGSIAVYDAAGLERLRVGLQPDGSFTSDSKNNPDPPPVPRPPLLTAGKGSVKIQSQGSLLDDASWPKDFSHLNVYAHVGDGPNQKIGTIAVDPGMFVLAPVDYVEVEVWFTSVNHSKKESLPSESAKVTPQRVVGIDLLDGIVTSLKLADEAVTRAKIAVEAIGPVQLSSEAVREQHIEAGAITGEKIRADTVTALHLVSRTITGLQIEAQTILGEHLAGRTITGDKIAALSITANEIAANSITAAKITAGSVTADKLEAVLLLASEIIAGDPTGGRVAFSLSGIDAFNLAGERTFQLSAQTGDLRMTGIMETGVGGSLVRISPGDPNHVLQAPGAYFYADESNFPAIIYAAAEGSAVGVRPSSLVMLASLDDTAGAGHISLRDQGVQFSYSRLFAVTGAPSQFRPCGGSVQVVETGVDMRTYSLDGLQTNDGGFAVLSRQGMVVGFLKSSATQAWLEWTPNGRLAMTGRWVLGHGDPDAGMIIQILALGGSGNFVDVPYGSTIANFSPRAIFCHLQSTASNYTWISSNSATGYRVQFAATTGSGTTLHTISMGVGT